jgi:hypothetical protein
VRAPHRGEDEKSPAGALPGVDRSFAASPYLLPLTAFDVSRDNSLPTILHLNMLHDYDLAAAIAEAIQRTRRVDCSTA